VLECLMLRNHSIIFSPIDFKKMLSKRDKDERFHRSTAQDVVKNFTKVHEVCRDHEFWPH
jgi:hypothetical protein